MFILTYFCSKPLKLKGDDDLIAYLKQIEVPLSEVVQKISQSLSGKENASTSVRSVSLCDENDQLLIRSAHREIKRRQASLLTNKRCSMTIEHLLRCSTAAQLVRFGEACTPYIAFIATNRHGSHVLQTFLGLIHLYLAGYREIETGDLNGVGSGIPGGDDDDHAGLIAVDDQGESSTAPKYRQFDRHQLDSQEAIKKALVHLMEYISKELHPHLHQLIYNDAGTHILRVLIGVLGGQYSDSLASAISFSHSGLAQEGSVAEFKKKKSKVKRQLSIPMPASFVCGYHYFQSLPEQGSMFKTAFEELTKSVLQLGTSTAQDQEEDYVNEELGALCCDANSSPTIQALLVASKNISPRISALFCRKLCNWGLDSIDTFVGKKRPRVSDIDDNCGNHWLGRLVVNANGSHAIQVLLTVADPALWRGIMKHFFQGRLFALSLHPFANFVVQTALITAPDVTFNEAMLKELLPHVPFLMRNNREGVVLHMVAAAAGRTSENPLPGVNFPAKLPSLSPEMQRVLLLTLVDFPYTAPTTEEIAMKELVESAHRGDYQATQEITTPNGSVLPSWMCTTMDMNASETAAESHVDQASDLSRRCQNAAFLLWIMDCNGARRSNAQVMLDSFTRDSNAGRAKRASEFAAVPPIQLSQSGTGIVALVSRFHPSVSKPFIMSLLSLPRACFVPMAAHPFFSRHVLENLIAAGTAQSGLSWILNKIWSALVGSYASLGASRFGCWVVSKLFEAVDEKKKRVIVEEISTHERAVAGTPGGKQLIRLVRLPYFQNNLSGWIKSWEKSQTVKDMMSDLLTDDTDSKQKKQLNKAEEIGKDDQETDIVSSTQAQKKAKMEVAVPPATNKSNATVTTSKKTIVKPVSSDSESSSDESESETDSSPVSDSSDSDTNSSDSESESVSSSSESDSDSDSDLNSDDEQEQAQKSAKGSKDTKSISDLATQWATELAPLTVDHRRKKKYEKNVPEAVVDITAEKKRAREEDRNSEESSKLGQAAASALERLNKKAKVADLDIYSASGKTEQNSSDSESEEEGFQLFHK